MYRYPNASNMITHTENVIREASLHQSEIVDIQADLGRFRDELYTTHLTFHLSPQGTQSATKNVQNIKESLDSWRDRVKARLDAVDELCAEGAATMPPEQYAALREKRNQLAGDYENVLRTVEGVYQRLNVLTSLLIEFSSLTSSMQSWMTDRTRLVGDVRIKSADPQMLSEARREARSLLDEITREESRLKAIGSVLTRIEEEIAALYAEAPSTPENAINANEVRETKYRVEDDYNQLVKQCQDLLQFQNRIEALSDEHKRQARNADDWLSDLERSIQSIEQMNLPPEEKLRMIDELNRQAAGEQSRLEDAEQASRKLLGALEGSEVLPDVKRVHESEMAKRRNRHDSALERLQQNVNSATAAIAASEGVKDSVSNLVDWAEQFGNRIREPKNIPLKEKPLLELKQEEQLSRSELDSRLALVDEMKGKLAQLEPKSRDAVSQQLHEAEQRLQKSATHLRGFRDNLNDALTGVQTLAVVGDKLSRDIDSTAYLVRATPARDEARIADAQKALDGINRQMDEIKQTVRHLEAIPNAIETDDIDNLQKNLTAKINAVERELGAKRERQASLENLEAQFDDAKDRAASWLNRFEDDLKKLTPVSIERPKLQEQRKELANFADRHQQGHGQMDELEAVAHKLIDAENGTGGGPRSSAAPRIVADLQTKYNNLGDALKSRGDKINKNEQRAIDVENAAGELADRIAAHRKALSQLPLPLSKDDAVSQLAQLERMDKSGRGEQRRLDELRIRARELANEAGDPEEAQTAHDRERKLADEWDNLADDFDAARARAHTAEKLLEGAAQVDKWLNGKKRMVDAIGLPSTEPGVGRTQLGQVQLMKAETDSEKPMLDKLIDTTNQLAQTDTDKESVSNLQQKISDLNRRWKSLEDNLNEKEDGIAKATALGNEIRALQKEMRQQIGELEIGVDKAVALPPGQVEKQLAALDELKSNVAGLDKTLAKLDAKLDEADEIPIDVTNRNDIAEAISGAKKKADEVAHKIDNVKAAALSMRTEGLALEEQLDGLLQIARQCQNELEQAPPITADINKLTEQSKASGAIHGKLIGKEGDVSLIRAKVADQLKKTPDAELKAKSDELSKIWPPLLVAAKDRQMVLGKVADLVQQFDDSANALENRLKADENELDEVISSAETDPAAACDALKLVESTMDRRLNETEALAALANRIENAAPGPDSNKLKRKADNMNDDAKNIVKRARAAVNSAQRKLDLNDKFEKLIDGAHQYLEEQNHGLKSMVGPALNRERVHSMLADVDGFWNRRHRELRATGDELQKILKPEEAVKIPETIENVDQKFSALISALKNLENQLDEKKDAVERARERTRRLVGDIQSLNQEIGDFDHIGRSRAELAKQLDECKEIDEKLNEKDAEVDKDLADWDDSFRDGVVTEPQLASNKAECDEAKRLIARAKKRLGQREKGIKQTQQEVEAIEKEAENLIAQLNAIQDADELKNGHTLVDPKKQAEKIKHLKEQLKPLSEKVDDFVADCKVLIKTAGPESDTSELDKALHDVNHAWSAASAALADRELAVDAAVQQMGRYEDAHRALLNWLEETEEMVENQKPPAADAKVAKAQHHAYDVLLKHIEDKQASVNGFSNLIDKMIEAAPSEEKKALKQKDDQIQQRYKDLLANAHDKQARLMEAVDLAERLSEISVPLESWLTQAEKRLAPLGKVPTTVERAHSQEEAQHNLAGELDGQQAAVDDVIALAPMLCALVSVDDAAVVEQQCRALSGRHEALRSNLATMQEAMASLAEQIGEFTANKDDMEAWLADTERRILELDELPIAPDDLIEQSNIVADLAVAVAEKDQLMTDIIETGRELCRQSEGDEAMQLQQQIDNMKIRYADIMSLTDEKLTLLTKAIPLSERFHDGFEDVIRWTEAVEQDLATLDEADLETQAHFLYNMEDDITKWRPEVDDLTAVSTQLQALCSPERAEELYQNTAEMNKIVNQIADKVGRRVERMDLADKQSRAVFDDLDFLVDWLSDARDRLIAAGPPSIDPEFLKTQLRNQKLMNDDVAANRTRLRDVIAEARKLARQLETVQGEEGAPVPISPLTERCDLGKQLIDEVGDLCTDRTEQLERAYVLAQQLANEFDELNDWCDDMEQELAQSPAITTVTPQPTLKVMHEHNAYLAQQVNAYRPIIDRFENDVRQLQEICAEPEAAKLAELAGEVINRYNELRDNIASRGAAIDSTIDATSGFGERLETFVQNLQGAADRLRDNDGISADPAVLQGRLAENQAILDSLRQKETAYAALKESAAELLSVVPQGDTAGAEVAGKLEKLEKLWKDIEAGAAQRGQYLEEVLNKAKNFWSELDQCQKAVDDLRVRLEAMEPATGQPLQLQAQQAQMHDVNAEMARTEPRITALTQAGVELASIIPAEEQAVIDAQVGAVHQGWNTITALFAQKNRDLVAAMDDAMAFHGDLQMLLGWLDGAEKHATQLPMPEHLKIDDIPALLDEIHKFKDEIDQKAVLKEQLAQTANKMAAGAPAHLAAVVREPIAELNARWARLYGALADRQHKVESALLHMGHIGDAADQLIAWMDKTKGTLNELTPTGKASLREIEIQQCKLTVVKNDVHAHEPRVASLNQAAARLVREDSQSETAGKINTMNDKWRDLNETLDSLSRRMDTAKGEIDSVGGEMDRWLGWLDDVEQQLATTKPTGGLPETAEAQMDDFRMLKAEIEGSAPQLDAYIRETDRYLTEHGNDTESWIGRNHPQIKQKWAKVKELTADREHKLKVALDDARALEAAMHDTEAWLKAAEAKLAKLPAVSRVPEPLAKQIEDHEEWTSDVSARKQIMAENQAAGARMQYYCEKKDAIPIKNKLVSLKHQFERVQARTAERAKQLQAANDEVQLWMGGVEELEDWMGDMEQRLEEQQPHTANLDKLKQQLDNIKETQKEISRKQPLFDITKKRGITLAEHAPKQEIKQIIARNDALARRWSSLVGKAIDRLQDAEQAVIEGGAFEEAVAEAEKWADAQIETDHHFDPTHVDGDIDTVRTLVEEDERRADERKAKKQGLERLLRKADELIGQEENAAERQAIEEAKDRLMAKWDEIEDNARSRSQSLKEAEKLADDFDAKAHSMLDWLAQTEQKLKGPTTDLAAALELVEQVKAELEEAKPKKEECIELAGKIQDHCHPKAEQPIKNWKKVIDGRWKEVADRADDREFALLEQIQNEKQREEQLQKMLKFVGEKKEELAKLAGYPPAENLEILQDILEEFAKFQEELREKQPEVDAVIKGQRKGVRNPAVDTLNAEWQQLWMDAMGLQSSLDNHEKLLEEMKRLEGWQWEDWKERYLEWNDHIKARVTDLFRRIDRSHTGFVPREVFIDAIIQSRFETSRLEMNKVADLFDKDGMINSKQFIDALRFDRNKRNREPVTPQQKISEEIRKQATACKCCQPFLIEKVGDMQYRFGDTQIKRMVRILRSTVMVRVGGGWVTLDDFLGKHDPCRAKDRTNIHLLFKDAAPSNAIDTMRAFTKNRHAKDPKAYTTSSGTPGPIMKIREKTERSLPMFGVAEASGSRIPRYERTPSDLSLADSRLGRPSTTNSRNSLLDDYPTRPDSRGSQDSERPTRIPSLRPKKSTSGSERSYPATSHKH